MKLQPQSEHRLRAKLWAKLRGYIQDRQRNNLSYQLMGQLNDQLAFELESIVYEQLRQS